MRIPVSALVMLAAISQLTACAIHRVPIATERYGVNRVQTTASIDMSTNGHEQGRAAVTPVMPAER